MTLASSYSSRERTLITLGNSSTDAEREAVGRPHGPPEGAQRLCARVTQTEEEEEVILSLHDAANLACRRRVRHVRASQTLPYSLGFAHLNMSTAIFQHT